jgi:Glycoside hydrolase family 44
VLDHQKSHTAITILALALFATLAACTSGTTNVTASPTAGQPSPAASIPTVPANLSATPGNAQVNLTWTQSSGAMSYHVKRAMTASGPYGTSATASSTSYTDPSLANGTRYYYVVSAVDSAGESANSSPVAALPAAPPAVLAAPTGLAAKAGNAQVSLQWNGSSGASSYHVKRATTSGGTYTQMAAPTAASYVDSGVANGTAYYYAVSAVYSAGESANSAEVSATPLAPTGSVPAAVTVTVTPASQHAISPYIYGVNLASSLTNGPPSLTFDRAGGNRWTAYNWETNASNAGSDYLYENDAYLSSGTAPAEAATTIISADQSNGMASLVTFQMQGLVSADESGPVSIAIPPDLSRFKKVVFEKGSAFTATPSTSDGNVYMDEFIWAIDQKFGGQNIFGTTPATQHVFAQLDNEPELWSTTHLEIQGSQTITSDAYITKTIALATALKKQFPNLVVFGPAHYGFYGLYAWGGELSPTPSGNNWFTDKYLPAIKSASATFGKPLVDVYDFHWYPEATDLAGNRITGLNGASLSDDQVQAIVQSPRSLWDNTYQEKSWITQGLGGPIYILGRLQVKIAAENPGMKLSITEYNNGGAQHIAGTIAQADNLGVFGAQSLFAANMWPLQANEAYLLAGFRAYRNFDGANHNFGDTSIAAASSNVGNVAVYVSTDTTRPGRVVMVAVNRSTSAQVTAIVGQTLTGTAHLFQMTAASAQAQAVVQPVAAGSQAVSGASLTVSLPALSVTTIDIY